MAEYSNITILYNPNSTGPGKKMAEDFHAEIKKALPQTPLELVATERAGHAEELTYELAKRHKTPLVISVSGDGGYNEVVNGAAKAYEDGLNPITSLLPAGNANDHHASLSSGDLLNSIVKHKIQHIDMLLLTVKAQNGVIRRRAHSYFGFGMSPRIGRELTKSNLNWLREKIVVIKGLFKQGRTRLIIDGEMQTYDSVIIGNIDHMAKVLSLSSDSDAADGLLEISMVKHKHRFSLSAFIAKSVLLGTARTAQTDTFSLQTVGSTLVQADGEVFKIPPQSDVRFTIDAHPLRCIL